MAKAKGIFHWKMKNMWMKIKESIWLMAKKSETNLIRQTKKNDTSSLRSRE